MPPPRSNAAGGHVLLHVLGRPTALADDALAGLLGAKAAAIDRMARFGLPTPAGFVITTAACREYHARGRRLWPKFARALRQHLAELGRSSGAPQAVSVRCSPAMPMPGLAACALSVPLDDSLQSVADCVRAAMDSWDSDIARAYRHKHGLPQEPAMAVIVQAMVFGNRGEDSGSGTAFTRHPATGEPMLHGRFAVNALGTYLPAGGRTPIDWGRMGREPAVLSVRRAARALECCFRDMQEFDFVIEKGRLYILQTRTANRSAAAAVRVAVDMARRKLIDRETAILRIDPAALEQLLHPTFDPAARRKVLARGLPASPGAASGRLAFSAQEAHDRAQGGERVILVRTETTPEDIQGMRSAAGVLTSSGGMTSHAAVVARGWGKCCVVGAGDLRIDPRRRTVAIGRAIYGPQDWISIDGATGEVMLGPLPVRAPSITGALRTLLRWADEHRTMQVRGNADTPADAQAARGLGAEGIGLVRTEHMFFDARRIHLMRQMILAETAGQRKAALDRLRLCQRRDFLGIIRAMRGLPVTIRLLDPPLHEFLPRNEHQQRLLAEAMGIAPRQVSHRVAQLREVNPMLGHRGDRLLITHPEILRMQVRAIIEAACQAKKQGIRVLPEIMVPLAGTRAELDFCRQLVDATAAEVMKETGVKVRYRYGTMIEVPRAALVAGEMAQAAEFFSFGTNDLTQLTFGYSRDDAGTFLPTFLDRKLLRRDPFQTLDEEGVGRLIEMAVKSGRRARPGLKCGLCGEHGGEAASVEFCCRVGLDYVSCSPYRVPIARLAAAQAAIRAGRP